MPGPLRRRRDRGRRRDHRVRAEPHHRGADQRRQQERRGGRQQDRGVGRADLPRGRDAVGAHQQDGGHGHVADGGVADLAGAQDRAQQRRGEPPARDPVDQQERGHDDGGGPGVVWFRQQERHATVLEQRRSQHREHGCAAGRPGQALAAGRGQGHGAGRDDQVCQRRDHMTGGQAQPGQAFGDRVQRQFEGVVGRVAEDPAVQQQMAVQQVPPLQRVVRPVGIHRDAERDPQEKREQGDAAAGPRRGRPPAARRTAPGGSFLASGWLDPARPRGRSPRARRARPV